jgi:peroxiredoxin
MAWTFVCPTEILAFSERAADFAARGASVVFSSTDSEYSLLAWTNASKKDGGLGKINIPLLSDKNHSIAKDYGVLIEEEGIALRGLFLIDPHGVVRQITINDLPVGRSVDETLRLIDAFQFTDKYGEVRFPIYFNLVEMLMLLSRSALRTGTPVTKASRRHPPATRNTSTRSTPIPRCRMLQRQMARLRRVTRIGAKAIAIAMQG